MALERSYVFHILKLLHDRSGCTTLDLWRFLKELRAATGSYRGEKPSFYVPPTVEAMEAALGALEGIGAVSRAEGREGAWQAGWDGPPRVGDGGGDGGDPGSGDSSGPLDGGGAGLGEILAHPVLFCVPEDARNRALDLAFGIPSRDGGGNA